MKGRPPFESVPTHLSEEEVAAFAEGSARPDTVAQVEAHVAECMPCCALVAAASKAQRDSGPSGVIPTLTQVSPRPPSSHSSLGKGDAIGRFVVLEEVGHGGMGVVYAALDPVLQRKVAVKLMKADPAPGVEAPGLFSAGLLREAQALARLAHPNVTAAFEVGMSGARPFVAMEFVEGGTLRAWLKAEKRSLSDILAVFIQAGQGLAAAHEAGLVHRDFKPDNVLMGADGRVRVTDFGLARESADRYPERPLEGDWQSLSAAGETTWGRIVGTPKYMAPEQLRGQPADARSDIFSYCVAIYEALYEQHPFGTTVHDATQQALLGRLRPPPSHAAVPLRLFYALERGLQADPEKRYPSLRSLLHVLAQPPTPHPGPWKWRGLALAAAGLLAVGGITAMRLWRPGPPPPAQVPALPAPLPPVASLESAVPHTPPAAPSPPPARPKSSSSRVAPSRQVTLHPSAAPAPAPTTNSALSTNTLLVPARLTLITQPPARVVFNGQSLGKTPLSEVRLPAGKHTLRLLGPEGQTFLLPIELVGGLTSQANVRLDSLETL